MFVPLVLSGQFLQPSLWRAVVPGYVLLTALSSLHVTTLRRPHRSWVSLSCLIGYGVALGLCSVLNPAFAWIGGVYTVLALFNGLVGRQIVVLDVIAISLMVMLKGMAGLVLIEADASAWGLISFFLAACTVAMGQRRNELIHVNETAREVLSEYSPQLLNQMLAVVTSSTLVAYSLYALAEGGQSAGNPVIYSTLLVNFGLFRYLFLVYHRDMTQGAELALVRDAPLLITLGLWVAFFYGLHHVI